ncbi:MAG: acyl transferase [Chitinophagaceae bacterium]|nr:MAG: acyl transferase [Chitinophagaceae bacterium]
MTFNYHSIFGLNPDTFNQFALRVFYYQAENNPIYKKYIQLLGVAPQQIKSIEKIPFLPIKLFKTEEIKTGSFESEKVFESSTTGGGQSSKHHIYSLEWYRDVFLKCFEKYYGNIKDYTFLALLPSYLERNNASLVYMVDGFMKSSGKPLSGFYIDDYEKLSTHLQTLEERKEKTILIGVSFALLDFAEKYPIHLKHTVIMETGGMKGRRKELWKTALHDILKNAFQTNQIHSEYGMTELLSQAYSLKDEKYYFPDWVKVLVRDVYDPFDIQSKNARGALNIIDLANIHSCCFLATDDIGELDNDGGFYVYGRINNADVRGCNLMVG